MIQASFNKVDLNPIRQKNSDILKKWLQFGAFSSTIFPLMSFEIQGIFICIMYEVYDCCKLYGLI